MDSFPLAKHFDEVSQKIKTNAKSEPDTNSLLLLYGLYKQATEGDNNSSEPYFYQMEKKAKWGAWNTHKGKSKAQAQHEYVVEAKKWFTDDLAKNYN
jgi:diazepam-binding inhibitor (GABA receptor modulating acyl-CoA-binding protein)